MNLYYLTTLTYPSTHANRQQVLKMCDAFSAYFPVTLVTADVRVSTRELFQAYAITHPFDIIPIPNKPLYPKSMWFALALVRPIHRAPQDTIFYCREPLLAFWLIFFSKRFRRCFFYESHSLHRFFPFIYKVVFTHARGVVVTTASKKTIMEGWGVRAPIMVEPNAIDISRFADMPTLKDARMKLNLPLEKEILLYIGGFIPDRGIYTLLEAARTNTNDSYYFLFVGGTPEQIQALGQHLNHPHVHSHSRIPYSDVPLYMTAADVLLAAPSKKYDPLKKYLHGSPLKIPEYMFAERPIVISDLPMVRELVSENEVFFFQPDDAPDLLRAIAEVSKDQTKTRVKVKNAKEKVLQHTWDKRAFRITQLIKTYYTCA